MTRLPIKKWKQIFTIAVCGLLMFASILFTSHNIIHMTMCTNISQQNNTIHTGNTFWHTLEINDGGILRNGFVHSFYLDNRQDVYDLKSFIITTGELTNTKEVYCLLWYQDNKHVYSVPGEITNVQISSYVVNRESQTTYLIICPLLGNDVPSYASLSFSLCDRPIASVIKIQKSLPESPRLESTNHNQSIGVCMTAQYGNVNDSNALFFVQWMEAMLMFGVNNVIMYNSSMTITGELYGKVLNYYQLKGVLSIQQFPVPYSKESMESDEYSAAESIRSLAVNDCFYREMHKHWYILHIDKDELIVPRKHKTYQQYLSHFIKQHSYVRPTGYIIPLKVNVNYIPSLIVPSTFYYTNSEKVNSEVPEYLPLLRFIYRQPTEPHGITAIGFGKSFVNPKFCNHVWSHRCAKKDDDSFFFLSDDDIIVHHYRNKCPPHNNRPVHSGGCVTESQRQYKDDFLVTHYGKILTDKTLQVLNAINYIYI